MSEYVLILISKVSTYSVQDRIVNTNIGIQYQFAPKLTLFVEPTLNWYIPNGSEVKNTWTERPFTLTVPFGIRLSW